MNARQRLITAGPLIWLLLAMMSPAPLWAQSHQGRELELWIEHLRSQLPASAADYVNQPPSDWQKSKDAVEGWFLHAARFDGLTPPDAVLRMVQRLLNAQQSVDELLESSLALRSEFATLDAAERTAALRSYLAATSHLIDLSGRLRSGLSDILDEVAYQFAGRPQPREELVDLLLLRRSAEGASVMSLALFDPLPDSPNRAQPASSAVKRKLLQLVAAAGQVELVPRVAAFAQSLNTPPELLVAAAETLRAIGLPQDERPGQDSTLAKPPITAARLYERLAKIPASSLPPEVNQRRLELLSWLDGRRKQGLVDASYRLGGYDVRPGDWLLMRNPSPYNLFTDLAPGLFTHVGVVALEEGSDGIRRMVLVDLPERGNRMPATNVEVFVQRTLHYVFLRHPDPAVAARMGEVAASVIGNPTQFDLNFRTDRVNELLDQPLAGKTIHTYCAGLLWLCAQETGRPRGEFFPLKEGVAEGRTAGNLAKLGVSMGSDFISPTGALFSPRLEIVGRRQPMYDARRQIEEAIYDHFAAGLREKELRPSTGLFQSLRLKLAEAARQSDLLAEALAQAAGVSAQMDLVAAAKTAAVVETLDEIAYGNSGQYRTAALALAWDGKEESLTREGIEGEQAEQIRQARQRHPDLVRQFETRRLTSWHLRRALVSYYVDRGKQQIDERFFHVE